MIDMDGLKPINDEFGHRFGDAALKEIAHVFWVTLGMMIYWRD